MASDLQMLVDQVSARVGVAALLEDHEQRPVAYSRLAGASAGPTGAGP